MQETGPKAEIWLVTSWFGQMQETYLRLEYRHRFLLPWNGTQEGAHKRKALTFFPALKRWHSKRKKPWITIWIGEESLVTSWIRTNISRWIRFIQLHTIMIVIWWPGSPFSYVRGRSVLLSTPLSRIDRVTIKNTTRFSYRARSRSIKAYQ